MKKRVYFLIGLPCSGKSYAAQAIAKAIGATYISTGDIARSLATPETWKETEQKDLFPGEEALRAEVTRQIEAATTNIVIVDGFPRSDDQATYLADKYWDYFPAVIEVSVGDWGVLPMRARMRGRDHRDSDPEEFMKRLTLASKNMEGVMAVLRSRLIDCYTLLSGADDFMIKSFKKIAGIKE